jgi:hypothetical protein
MRKDGQTDRHNEANSRFFEILRTRLKDSFYSSIDPNYV